jgi:hypothetical protein
VRIHAERRLLALRRRKHRAVAMERELAQIVLILRG